MTGQTGWEQKPSWKRENLWRWFEAYHAAQVQPADKNLAPRMQDGYELMLDNRPSRMQGFGGMKPNVEQLAQDTCLGLKPSKDSLRGSASLCDLRHGDCGR